VIHMVLMKPVVTTACKAPTQTRVMHMLKAPTQTRVIHMVHLVPVVTRALKAPTKTRASKAPVAQLVLIFRGYARILTSSRDCRLPPLVLGV
jgi:hypothetical protein